MGSGFSDAYHNSENKEQDRKNRNIEKDLQAQKKQDKLSQKLLLLGPGESGKSTVLKQMRIIHHEGFSEEEAEQQKLTIRINIVQSMACIINAFRLLQMQCPPEIKQDMDMVLVVGKMLDEGGDAFFSFELTHAIKRLWQHEAIQECYDRRAEYQLIDSAKYVVDVGGQRSERRKWIQCFNDVNSIMFIASLSEYNQKLEEDESINRMQESLQLFQWVCNHEMFLKTPIILFLNKKDIFHEKIETVPITVAFPEYAGSQIAEECIDYIKGRYLELNYDPKERFIYSHITCATDTSQVTFVINSSIDTILEKNLSTTGLT